MNFNGLIEKAKKPFTITKEKLSVLRSLDFSGVKEKLTVFPSFVSSQAGSFLGRFSEGKRRPILIGLGGMAVLFLVFVIIILAVNSRKPKANTVSGMAAGLGIPVEELFYPAEPDFLPDFIPEREPRSFWSLEDIRQYWKTPGEAALWREEIISAVDKLMEDVP
jgi:hypothetical protein